MMSEVQDIPWLGLSIPPGLPKPRSSYVSEQFHSEASSMHYVNILINLIWISNLCRIVSLSLLYIAFYSLAHFWLVFQYLFCPLRTSLPMRMRGMCAPPLHCPGFICLALLLLQISTACVFIQLEANERHMHNSVALPWPFIFFFCLAPPLLQISMA